MLFDQNISRKHSKIIYLANKFFVYDNESLNGTFLNGKKINEAEINNGDLIKIGETEFKFEYERDGIKKEGKKFDQKTLPLKESRHNFSGKPRTHADKGRMFLYGGTILAVFFVLILSPYLKKQKGRNPINIPTATAKPEIAGTEAPIVKATPSKETPKELDATQYYSQGLLSMMAENYKEAIALFQKTLEIDPENRSAGAKLKKCKELLGKNIEDLYSAGVREYDILYYERAILQWNKVVILAKDFDTAMYKKAKDRIEEAQKRNKSVKNK